MILRRLLWIFILLIVMGIGQTVATNLLAWDSVQGFRRISDETTPILITVNEIQISANKIQNEAISLALTIAISDEDIDLDLTVLAEADSAYTQAEYDTDVIEDDEQIDNEESAEDAIFEEFEELEASILLIHQQIEELHTYTESIDTLSIDIDALHTAVSENVRSNINLIMTVLDEEDPLTQLEAKAENENTEEALEETLNEILAIEQLQLADLRQDAQSRLDRLFNQSIISMVVRTLVILLIFYFISRWIINPINRIRETTDEIATGKFDMQVEQKSDGEIGSLELALNRMLSAIRERDVQTIKLNELLKVQVQDAENARAEAERSNRVKSSFLASMSHELRTPMNAIINFTKFVAQGDLGEVNDDQQETLMEVVDSGKHLLHLINDVLDMSKIESGALNLFVQENVDIQDIIGTVHKSGTSLIQDKNIDLRKVIPDELPKIRADQQRIRQILTNLVSNAIKFTENGFVEIRASYDETHIKIVVQDSGMGIAANQFDAIFDAFHQTEAGALMEGGTGLGLPISKRLAGLHEGRIWLESEVGQGSIFYLELPIQSENLEVYITE